MLQSQNPGIETVAAGLQALGAYWTIRRQTNRGQSSRRTSQPADSDFF